MKYKSCFLCDHVVFACFNGQYGKYGHSGRLKGICTLHKNLAEELLPTRSSCPHWTLKGTENLTGNYLEDEKEVTSHVGTRVIFA